METTRALAPRQVHDPGGVEAVRQLRAADPRMPFNGGRLLARALERRGVKHLFTLSGGHLFPLYDGCVELGIRIIDVRHEEHAVHAAEGWSKVTRTPGVAALTAGPGVTNGMTGIVSAFQNRTPVVVLGGRAPDARWGKGSLQEMDHVPMLAPVTKFAETFHDAARLHLDLDRAWDAAVLGAPGPAFADLPIDALFSPLDEAGVEWPEPRAWRPAPDPDLVRRAVEIIDRAQRPVVLAGSGAYWHEGEAGLLRLVEAAGLPVYSNGLGRGLVPADHPNHFSRTRSHALGAADVVLLVGTPLDFRLNFGQSPLFNEQFELIRLEADAAQLEHNRVPDVGIAGHIGAALEAMAAAAGGAARRAGWLADLRQREQAAAEKDRALLESDADPIHPMRVFGEVLKVLDRDAIVVGDGGDFVSYAGRLIPTFAPGHFLDSGPFGALGMGPGQAIAARLAHPDKQVLLVLGDGAFGFGAMEFDTMVRHRLPVVAVVGNNAAWGLEKHPMNALFGYAVAAELNPGARYDQVVEALGGHGELVTRPDQIGPALGRAFDSGLPALVNVTLDPAAVYPRQSNLM